MLIIRLSRTWDRVKLIATYAACLSLLMGGVQLAQYEEPPNAQWVSLVGMVAFPLGFIFVLSSVCAAAWVTIRHIKR
jgi:hypothetical protein